MIQAENRPELGYSSSKRKHSSKPHYWCRVKGVSLPANVFLLWD
uniref:Uncharacterized protein n=1 Tax=Anguilla anguilla TaxID=7936 RepID=A0A0E9RBC9_ANGAN